MDENFPQDANEVVTDFYSYLHAAVDDEEVITPLAHVESGISEGLVLTYLNGRRFHLKIEELPRATGEEMEKFHGQGPALIAGMNFPLALVEVIDGWEDKDAIRALRDYRQAGGDESDPEAFDKFLQNWSL